MTIAESLSKAEALLTASGVAEPRREAASLLALATQKDKTFFYTHRESELSKDEINAFDLLLQRRANREPLQYISGVQEFYGLGFEVSPDVLIPRPETEMVVERALEILNATNNATICDVGTGSGCIIISILHQLRGINGVGLDVSSRALEIARRNSDRHGVTDRLRLMESDVFDSLENERFDMIVSNPPYVPAQDIDGLQAEVRDFEPQIALTDRSDGLSIIRRIVEQSPKFLTDSGHLLLEIGFDQSVKVADMFDPAVWSVPELLPDLQGIPRLVCARLI